MTTFDSLTFDNDWRVYPPEYVDPAYGTSQLDDSSWDNLETLADWPHDRLPREGLVHLRHTFDLQPIGEVCLRFVLHTEAAPDGTEIYVNGWHTGTVQVNHPLTVDVTDYVTLDANVLLLRVHQRGDFGRLVLQPVPCDEQQRMD